MRWLAIIALCLMTSGNAQAWRIGKDMRIGKAQLNVGKSDFNTGQALINLFWNSQIQYNLGATPAALDVNGFPIQNFSGTIGGQIAQTSQTLLTTGPFVLGWSAGASCFKINFLNAGTVSANPQGITVTNGSGVGNLSLTGKCDGIAGSVTVTWTNTNGLTYSFDGTYTSWGSNVAGSATMYLVRSSDLASYNAGRYWTPEMVTFITALRPESLRLMGVNVQTNQYPVGSNVTNWSTRKTTSNYAWFAQDFPPSTRCGGDTSFCTISVSSGQLTASAASGSNLSGWTDGEQITGSVASSVSGVPITAVGAKSGNGHCQFTIADTSILSVGQKVFVNLPNGSTECNAQTTVESVDNATQFTIPVTYVSANATNPGRLGYQTLSVTGKSGGSVLIANWQSLPIGSNSNDTIASGNGTFTYIATLNRLVYTAGGITNALPLEAQVQLSNLINANFWYNFPAFATDSFITSSLNAIYPLLNRNLKLITEYNNENWNTFFTPAYYMLQMGFMLGLTTSSPLPYESLRVRIINGYLIPNSAWSAAMSRVERTYCFQAAPSGYTTQAVNPMIGSTLVSPGSSTYQSYVSPYIAAPGTTGYGFNSTVASGGNGRPIDYTESVCYAPYVGGGSALSGQSVDAGATPAPTSYDATLLNSIVSNWNSGATGVAISLIDQSIRGDYLNRQQTVTASGTTFTTPLDHNFSVNQIVRFTVSGGTTYSGLNTLSTYRVLSVPTTTTFTVGRVVNGTAGSAVNAGTAGSGTTSVGFLSGNGPSNPDYSNTTIFGVMSGAFTKYQDMAVNGFATAPAGGAPNVRWYEGALEPTAPTTAQCATISINSTDCATIATALLGWKNDPMANATSKYMYDVFKGDASGTITTGAMSKSSAPAQLVLNGGGAYGLNSNYLYVGAAPWQMYYGFQAFSSP